MDQPASFLLNGNRRAADAECLDVERDRLYVTRLIEEIDEDEMARRDVMCSRAPSTNTLVSPVESRRAAMTL